MSAINPSDAAERQGQTEATAGVPGGVAAPRRASNRAAPGWTVWRAIDAFLGLLSAVRFGVVLLVLLIIACMIGMLIQQVELETFPKYLAALTPGEKTIYGTLGFFDIYHARYFHFLLGLLSLNIILASIDHFPKAWSFVRKKKLTASPTFAMTQRFRHEVNVPGLDRAEVKARAVAGAKAQRFRIKVTDEETRTTIFAERGSWNRLGAYAVHVALLTIFTGYFLTSRGHTGGMWVEPGKTSDRMSKQVFNLESSTSAFAVGQQELELPFSIEGVDIEQKLIDKSKGIDAGNTLDWLTTVKIRDAQTDKETSAIVHMNKPFDYRGYRLFQASFMNLGSARKITLRATPSSGGPSEEVAIPRNGEARLPDGTLIRYVEFNPDFTVDGRRQVQVGPGAGTYNEPAAHLEVVKPNGQRAEAWAFTQKFIDQMQSAPFMQANFFEAAGLRFTLLDFEKVPQAHMLSIQYDPGTTVVYIGFTSLCLMLIGVFFFSHQRLWIVIEDGKAYLGGDSNRNRLGFEDRAKRIAAQIVGT
ncbi:MAG: cytochrome c biogenesis protein ResB [Acidobacteriota bacterium]